MVKLNCQQPLHQSSVSHNPSKIILICIICAYILLFKKTGVKQIVIFHNITLLLYFISDKCSLGVVIRDVFD